MSREQIKDVVDSCIEQENLDVPLSPALIAKCAYDLIDPDHESPWLVQYSSNQYLREIARERLRRTFDPLEIDKNKDQVEMFEKLQDMYPAHRPNSDGKLEFNYVPRMQLTYEERLYNIERMEREIISKQKHVDALRAETDHLLDEGFFSNQASG